MKKIKILFVCLGNICRSPLAHAVMQDLVEKNDWEDMIEIESCGTGDWHVGQLPDQRMVEEAKKHGVNMTHRALSFDEFYAEYYDLILPMDQSNKEFLISNTPSKYRDKIKLFRTFDPLSKEKDAEVPDPYFGGAEGFRRVYDIVERTCQHLLKTIINK